MTTIREQRAREFIVAQYMRYGHSEEDCRKWASGDISAMLAFADAELERAAGVVEEGHWSANRHAIANTIRNMKGEG